MSLLPVNTINSYEPSPDNQISFSGNNVSEIKEYFKRIRSEEGFKRGLLTIKESDLSSQEKRELRRYLSVVLIKCINTPNIMKKLNRAVVEYVMHPSHEGRVRQDYNHAVNAIADEIGESYQAKK